MKKQRKWSAAQKFEIALCAIKGDMTINDICQRYQISPSQVHSWKKQLIEQGANVFSKNDKEAKAQAIEAEQKQSQLYEKIGQLTVERDFLKKSAGKFPHLFDGD